MATPEQDFLPYAVGGSANVLSQAAYAALTTLLQNGLTSGIVPSNELNKILRQPSIIASVIGQFIVANSGQPAIDDGTTATLLANFTTAINAASKSKIVLTDTGAANAYAAANPVPLTALPTTTGFTQTVKIAHLNTGTSTYAPDGLATAPIYSLAGALLQGNELPVNGVATLVSFVDPLLNSGNLCWVLYECVGGAQPVAPATASQHAVQFGQVAGVVGSAQNLAASLAATGTSLPITADEIVAETALGGLLYRNANVNDTFNGAITGAGGMDTGSLPTSGFVAIYRIFNPATSTWKFYGTNATSAVVPNVYGGATGLPSGYTASALVSIWPTNTSAQLSIGRQSGRRFSYTGGAASILSSTSGATTQVSLSAAVAYPLNAKWAYGQAGVTSATVAQQFSTWLSATNTGANVGKLLAGYTPVGGACMGQWDVAVVNQQIWYNGSVSTGANFSVAVWGYDF